MNKILIILRKKDIDKCIKKNKKPHFNWINDCGENYDFDFWGEDVTNTSLQSLKNKISSFKPDFIYLTMRKKYQASIDDINKYWLPDLTNIKVPKIFVEVDTYKYDVNDSWYKQFDKVYCRCPWWNNWNNVPLFRWSVPEKAFPIKEEKRNGIFFIGKIDGKVYKNRRKIKNNFKNINFIIKYSFYWKYLHKSSALICPTESRYGAFIPAKLFEYLASGAAVITNCDLEKAGIPELEPYIIRYKDLDDLKEKLELDFTSYHNEAIPLMKQHTHKIRYRELFE